MKKSGKKDEVNALARLGKVQKFNSRGILIDGNSKTGWQHIDKRHVSGTAATKGTTLFPKHLGEAKIKNLIMESLEKGQLASVNPKDGIDEMTTVVTDNYVIKTSYPTSGKSVITKK
ncbi:hypothetical protein [Lysinibacillus sp. Y5S-8]|uniref:hypothetical protein n=1 Tax=Lysinibacillus sp. Y5S-8 TaxID=3122488 RepID=UPI0030CB6C62